MHVGLGRQLKETEAILTEEDVPIDCCPSCTQDLPKKKIPEVILLADFSVRKCHGCKGEIIRTMCPTPKDLHFHRQALKIWKDQKLRNGSSVMEMFVFT